MIYVSIDGHDYSDRMVSAVVTHEPRMWAKIITLTFTENSIMSVSLVGKRFDVAVDDVLFPNAQLKVVALQQEKKKLYTVLTFACRCHQLLEDEH